MALRAVYLTDDAEPCQGAPTGSAMISALVDHYRCPDDLLQFDLTDRLSEDSGFFRFGYQAICYGRSASGYRTPDADALLYGSLGDVKRADSTVLLPFSPTEIIDNLRLERYARRYKCNEWSRGQKFLRDAYYFVRPLMGLDIRTRLKRVFANGWRHIVFPRWPVDTTVEQLSEALVLTSLAARGVTSMPFVWFWPRGAKGCVMMTHDVEGKAGYEFCRELMNIDDAHGMKASLQLLPEGSYRVSQALLQEIRERGFEANVQDLNHDGYLFSDRQEFLRRVRRINQYGQLYGASGFRAAVMYRNLDWYDALEFSYDMSVPNVAHLDPQRGGCCTVMPYFIGDVLEIPLTTAQDYMLFHLLGDYSLDLWQEQTETILGRNGLASFLIHPDYVIEERARGIYAGLLSFLRTLRSQQRVWFALPREVDKWWRARSQMRVVKRAGRWHVEGPGAEEAVVAFARIAGDHLEYEVDPEVGRTEGI